jgi:predicted aspartyl protease/Tfp pilus assembly protein PilF
MSIFAKSFLLVSCLAGIVAIPVSAMLASDSEIQLETDRQMIKRAQKELRRGDSIASEETLRKLVARTPDSTEIKLLLSYVLLKQKRHLESFDIAFEILKLNRRNAKAQALLGFGYLNTGNFIQARIHFANAYAIDRSESLSWEGAGLLDFYENRLPESLSKLREAAFLNSQEPDFLYTLAQVEARSENYKEAAAAYRSFLQVAPKNDTVRREKIRGLIDFLEYLGNRSSLYDLSGAKQTTIPIEIVNQRPILKIKLGKDQREYRFVLDTGSSVTVVSEKTAKEIGMKPVASGGQASAIGGTGKFNIVYGFLNSIGIGDCRIRNVPIYIRKFHDQAETVDGFIGLAVISRFLTTLDYENSSLTLVKNDEKEVAKVFTENDLSIPLRLTTSGFLSGEVRIQGIDLPFYFIVDTGASISVISTELASTMEIGKFATEEKIRVVGAGGVLDEVQSYLLPKITFGNHFTEDVSAVALDLNIINENSGFLQAGILGGNVLRKYRLTFDFKGSKIAFQPNKRNEANIIP